VSRRRASAIAALNASYDGFRCHAGTILDSSWSPTALELIEISSSSTE
jgi:hypothetical protein